MSKGKIWPNIQQLSQTSSNLPEVRPLVRAYQRSGSGQRSGILLWPEVRPGRRTKIVLTLLFWSTNFPNLVVHFPSSPGGPCDENICERQRAVRGELEKGESNVRLFRSFLEYMVTAAVRRKCHRDGGGPLDLWTLNLFL